MKTTLLFLLTLLISGCMQTPEAPASKEILAKEKIQDNKTEAELAKEEYLRLQRLRTRQ